MWIIISLIVAILGGSYIALLRRRNSDIKMGEWILGIGGFLLLIFTAHDVEASFAEHNEVAAWTFLWLTGIPAVMLLWLAWFFSHRRAAKNRRAKRAQ